MRFARLVLLFAASLLPFGLAQEPPPVLTLPVAVGRGVGLNPEVIAARTALEAAERARGRTTADPFALRLPKLEARHAVEDARAALAGARLAARAEVERAYFGALEADDAVQLARSQREIAQTTLEATRIRFEAGAATGLEVDRAENGLRAAERALTAARSRRTLTYGGLGSLLGLPSEALTLREPKVDPVAEPAPRSLDENAELRRAEGAVLEARVYLEGIDNAFSARVEVEGARAAYESARSSLRELRRSLAFGLQASRSAVTAARDSLAAAAEALATAEEGLRAQRLRFEAGSISALELAQAELEAATGRAQVRAARHALVLERTALEQAVQGSGSGGSPPALAPSLPTEGGLEEGD